MKGGGELRVQQEDTHKYTRGKVRLAWLAGVAGVLERGLGRNKEGDLPGGPVVKESAL